MVGLQTAPPDARTCLVASCVLYVSFVFLPMGARLLANIAVLFSVHHFVFFLSRSLLRNDYTHLLSISLAYKCPRISSMYEIFLVVPLSCFTGRTCSTGVGCKEHDRARRLANITYRIVLCLHLSFSLSLSLSLSSGNSTPLLSISLAYKRPRISSMYKTFFVIS